MLGNREILIWLNSIGVGNRSIKNLYDNFDDIKDIWYISRAELEAMGILQKTVVNRIIKHRDNKFIEELIENLQKKNVTLYTVEDEKYPKNLLNIDNYPFVLYSKGKYIDEEQLSIAVVGSRKSTSYGRWACEKFTRELAKLGITIVSGLALGIDATAHRVALEEGAPTIGVLGNGIDLVYPKRNKNLYEAIEENGCVLTEFPLGTEPLRQNFPQRNRIISGLSLGIIVIEAQEKSGSLITAHLGLEQGKDVFAVPGNINSLYSSGTNKLIKDGASPLLDIDDVLEEIYELRSLVNNKKKEEINYSEFSDDELEIIKILETEPIHSDVLVIKTGKSISTVMGILTGLELKGVIKELSRNVFSLT